MTDRIQVSINAMIPRELLFELVQHIRDFDVDHADCQFGVFTAGGAISPEEVMDILKRVTPPFPYLDIKKRN